MPARAALTGILFVPHTGIPWEMLRGRPGTIRHLITDRRGIPLGFRLTGANVHRWF